MSKSTKPFLVAPDSKQDREMSQNDSPQIYCEAIKASDRGAFGALFRRMRGELLRYVRSIVHDDATSHDLIQDVFVSLWGLRESLDPSKSLKAYLYQMARNRAIRHLRDERIHDRKHDQIRRTSSGHIPLREWPDAGVDAAVLTENLTTWVSDLPERQREALMLSRFQGLTHKEIADIMAISPRTVNNHIMRALSYLQQQIEAFEPSLLAS